MVCIRFRGETAVNGSEGDDAYYADDYYDSALSCQSSQ